MSAAMDGFERQPGLWSAVIGLFGSIIGSIEAIELTLRLVVMAITGIAAFAGFLYNMEKWRKERSQRMEREKNDVR